MGLNTKLFISNEWSLDNLNSLLMNSDMIENSTIKWDKTSSLQYMICSFTTKSGNKRGLNVFTNYLDHGCMHVIYILQNRSTLD